MKASEFNKENQMKFGTPSFGKILSVAIAALILSACVATAPKLNASDPQSVANAIKVKRDEFKKMTNYTGPNASLDILDQVFIRAWKLDATGGISYQIYVADYYSGEWRFYSAAHDLNGNRLETTQISRDVESCNRYSCSHTEHLGLNVTREYLEKYQDSGLNFQVSGKAGEQAFFIPGGYIKAFLSVAK